MANKNNMDGYRPPDPAEVEKAVRLRAAYIAAVRELHGRLSGVPSRYNSHPRWDGGRCPKTGRVYKTPVWPGLVKKAEAAGADPVGLVATLFRHWSSDTVPTPHQILNADVLRRYRDAAVTEQVSVGTRLRTDEANWRAALWAAERLIPDPEAAARAAVLDLSRPLSPLFRYCAARCRGFDDVAAAWAVAARRQFDAAPTAYRYYWSALLPPEMAEPAAGVSA